MKTRFFKNIALFGGLAASLLVSSCTGDLDRTPFIEVTSATVYNDPAAYKQAAAKLYAGLALTGQEGPAGKPDLGGIDEGFSSYLRQYWQLQELPTDEAVIAWGDAGLPEMNTMQWSSNNPFVRGLYNRIFYQIAACNEYIREASDAKLSSRGITGTNLTDVKYLRTEARFLRALSYWHALDMFGGNVPFVTEADAIGSTLPKQTNASALFTYIETELKAIEPEMMDARKNEYARADKAAVWMLLAKLYLNAEAAGVGAKYADAATYAKKVIDAGYTLESKYTNLFRTDNNNSKEVVFPVAFDGVHTKTWGGMTFLVHAPVGGSMSASSFGIDGGWGGLRTTKAFVSLFADPSGKTDTRAMFYTDGQKLEIEDLTQFSNGYAISKWKNISSTGAQGSDIVHPDTDFPMFRLADAYLIYAEAATRGAGDRTLALQYVNALRTRAYGNANGNITAAQLTADFILDERARELYWEGSRRTDLIRFNKYTSATYVWPWKGGVKDGKSVSDYLKFYPIPSTDLTANPNLKQNTGY
ncbi:RagB/SusD family nutrient uptake outer membrane protein [Flectobacillus sp. DC10W]|uniref:RagB/SusD family nutrient uptake outer membrane protein n=1 Tax=Flectobacillus longus TaxID=2984207 RepID=A0ABT6YL86_9BACT|nr:RagB/SusD family nutrient uptake outer membrane protein [Flectobacillus longus]MDI9864196.1 RagB/SusD family nutrient uptake outer membrane protein [Flectobacillus longus]